MAKKQKTDEAPGPNVEIVRMPLDQLVEAPVNPREHPERNQEAIKASLSKFGQVEALVVRKANKEVIGGNGRLAAMREMGWQDAVCWLVDCDEKTALALGVALNRTAETATWNEDTLAAVFRELKDGGWDMSELGWSDDEVMEMLSPPEQPSPPAEFQEYDETIRTDYKCPKCGYEWSGGERHVKSGDGGG